MSELTDDRLRERLAEYIATEWDFEINPVVGAQWPQRDGDDGYRGNGGYVALQPADVLVRCREQADRLLSFLRAAASTRTEGAGVKALEWRVPRQDSPRDPDAEDVVYCADGIGGLYSISRKQKVGPERLLWWAHDPFDWTGFDSIDAAKAAAQADFEARIRSALNPPAPKVTTDEAEERG